MIPEVRLETLTPIPESLSSHPESGSHGTESSAHWPFGNSWRDGVLNPKNV